MSECQEVFAIFDLSGETDVLNLIAQYPDFEVTSVESEEGLTVVFARAWIGFADLLKEFHPELSISRLGAEIGLEPSLSLLD